jgi:hypothetical protein
MTRGATSTSAFGVSKRESHDSSGFYHRFASPVLSDDAYVHAGKTLSMGDAPFVFLAPGLPTRGSTGAEAVKAVTGRGRPVYATVEIVEPSGLKLLIGICGERPAG